MKVVKYGVLIIGILIILLGGVYLSLLSRMPDLDGTVHTDAVREKVRVIRDNWGIPHIEARNGRDAYFAYGYTIAQDRLFQMELHRRIARGELSEIFGPKLIRLDRKFRTLLFRHTAEKNLKRIGRMHPEALEILDAFLAGINYFMKTNSLPIEFTLLGINPRQFTRLDCLSMVCYMAYTFAYGIDCDSMATILKNKYPDHNIMELFPGYSREEPVTIMESQAYYTSSRRISVPGQVRGSLPDVLFSDHLSPAELFAKSIDPVELIPIFEGSNSWVIAPFRSKSGAAILANDGHVALSNPGVWYEAHVRYGDVENYGQFLPLIPFPLFAHNQHRAWAITMFENDDLDLYAETFHPRDKHLVMYRKRWVPVRTIRELITVKGCDDNVLEIRVTPHGPIITEYLNGYQGKPVSISWVCHRADNPVINIMYRMSISRTMEEFRNAISELAAPGLNFSYADRLGNIAWWAAGRLPIRPGHVKSKEILDGSSGRDEIRGYLPFDKNPHLVNPPSGIIVTANNKSTSRPVGPIPDLQGYWVPTDRAARIVELLSGRERWSIDDLIDVQNDVGAIAAPPFIAAVVPVLDERSGKDDFNERERAALELLHSWDFQYTTDATGATVYHFLTYHILREAVLDELGEDLFLVYCNLSEFWNFLKAFVRDDSSRFWDRIDTPEIETREEILVAAFRAAVKEIEERCGEDTSDWQWGRFHTIEYRHPIGLKKPMNLIFNLGPFPAPGEARTINRMKSHFGRHDYKVESVPSFRKLIDYSDLSRSLTILPSGNSGNILSPHYSDQVNRYLCGQYRVINMSGEQIEKEKRHEIVFLPPQ